MRCNGWSRCVAINNAWVARETRDALRGKVVLLDFRTFGCVHCLNTLPHIKAWHERYRDRGLVVIGLHTPEFAFEASRATSRTRCAGWASATRWPSIRQALAMP